MGVLAVEMMRGVQCEGTTSLGQRMGMRYVWLSALVLGVLSLFGAFPSWAGGDPIRIGASVSMTGDFATEVGPFKKLMQAWADQVNARGGVFLSRTGLRHPLELLVYDDQSSGPAAGRLYARLAEKERVDFLLGPYSSPLTFSASIPAERQGIPFLAVCANSSSIYERGFQWLAGVIDRGPRYTYRYWDMIAAENKARTVAFVVEDGMHPRSVYAGARELAVEAGLTEVLSEVVPPGVQDLSGLISRLKDRNADIVFLSSNIPLAINFIKQAREKSLSAREFHCIHHSGVFRRSLGRDAEGVVGQSYWTPGMGQSGEADFLEILSASGIDAGDYPWAPAYMCAFQMVEQAFQTAGTKEPAAVMKALKSRSFETLCGPNQVGEDGFGRINTYPSQILGGRYEIVWPPGQATAAHIYPFVGR